MGSCGPDHNWPWLQDHHCHIHYKLSATEGYAAVLRWMLRIEPGRKTRMIDQRATQAHGVSLPQHAQGKAPPGRLRLRSGMAQAARIEVSCAVALCTSAMTAATFPPLPNNAILLLDSKKHHVNLGPEFTRSSQVQDSLLRCLVKMSLRKSGDAMCS